jgi:hypothetical protein
VPDQLKAITLYLPHEEAAALEREAATEGRSGVSAQIRWILALRRRKADDDQRGLHRE